MTHSVLVVEDEKNIVLSLTFLLKKAGFETRVVGDGNAALDEIRKAHDCLGSRDVFGKILLEVDSNLA